MQQNQERYPLVSMQQGMLYDTLLRRNKDADVLQIVCRLKGQADSRTFQKAWRLLVDRHPALRISCQWEEGEEPSQIIHERLELDWIDVDWRDRSPEPNEAALEEFLASDLTRDFDLARPPLMRLAWIAMGGAEQCMVWTFHHLLLDGRSLTLVLEDLFELTRKIAAGSHVEAPRRPDYREHLKWFQNRDFSFAESWWKQKLQGISEATVLRVEKNSHSSKKVGFDFAEQKIELDGRVLKELSEYVAAAGVTLNTLVQGAWAILLGVYSGKTDVVYGAVRACRRSSVPGAEQMVGVFINTVPVRVSVQRDADLGQWLNRLRAQHVEVRDYEHTPLFQIQRWSEVGGGVPLLWSLVAFEQYDLSERLVSEEEGQLRAIEIRRNTTFPITLAVKAARRLDIRIFYHRNYYADETVKSVLHHFKNLLTGFLTQKPGATLANLPVLDTRERRMILEEWNATEVKHRREVCLHELFEEQVARTPGHPAVIFRNQQLTYSEFNRRANQLAHWLRKRGVGPETLVGLVMERSLEMVVGIFGILKAGGAYVPLDPEQPRSRLERMAAAAGLKILLTQAKFVGRVSGSRCSTICLDAGWKEVSGESEENPERLTQERHLAYVIHTSGSTGKPKGVMIEHAAIRNHMQWMRRAYPLSENDAVLQKTPFTFDASVWEFFAPLFSGARLFLAEPGEHRDIRALAKTIREAAITVVQFVPSLLRVALEEQALGDCPTLRRIFCGGEPLDVDLVRQFSQQMRGASLHNLYGPSEATVDTTVWDCQYSEELQSVPIGKPIDNVKIYILDESRNPVSVGVAGEIFIGGAGVARGYLKQPELTAEKFIANPFSDVPGSRLYRSGDLGRYRPDGNIEYLGRLDHQIKIRGARIELGEIEAALTECEPLKEAVVETTRARDGNCQLAAFYTLKPDRRPPLPEELRVHLNQRLPEYMIPVFFVPLERMPLTAGGKVDRKSLAVPENAGRPPAKTHAAPSTDLERRLAEIWSELLGVSSVGVKDNFFDLGGHSLLAVKLFSRIQNLTGKDLPLSTLFRAPTIEQLAKILDDENRSSDWSPVVPIKAGGSRPPFFCVHDIGGNVLVYQHFHKYVDPEQPLYGLQAQGLDGSRLLHDTLEEMASCYIDEMRKLQPRGPYYLGGHCFGGILAYEIAQQLSSQGESIGLLAMFDAYPPRHAIRRLKGERRGGRKSRPASTETDRPASVSSRLRVLFHGTLNSGKALLWRTKRWFARFYIPSHLHAVEKNCHRAWWHYYPKPYGGKITLFRARERNPGEAAKKMARWRPYAHGGLDVVDIPASHGAMMRNPRVRELVVKLGDHLRAARAMGASLAKGTRAPVRAGKPRDEAKWQSVGHRESAPGKSLTGKEIEKTYA